MVATVKFLIFAHGNVIRSEESVSYDRDPLRKIRVKTDASYEDLVNAICAGINIDQTTHQITVHHRHPQCVEGRVYYSLLLIRDDTDVEDLVEMAEKKGEEFIQELYIEIFERSITLSEHEMRQVDMIMPLIPKVYPLKRDRTVQNDDFMPKRTRYDIHLSKDISNNHQQMNSVPQDPPTEMDEDLVVTDLRYENPSQNVMIHKLDDPVASPISPSQMSMNITNGMEEGNQTLRASSSTTLPAQDYEVFLSFRGKDTRCWFADHLYNGLVNAGVLVFRDDDELPLGKEIGFELLKAIKASRISIPIISKNYASSSWCLWELVQFLECMKTSSQVMLPIFYQVKPSEVRNQTGDFGKGFCQCKDEHYDEESLIQEWTNALKEVASLKGWESTKIANGHEAELVRVIVDKVLQVLRKVTLPIRNHLVGVEDRVQTIIKMITKAKESSDVQAIVIHGMGGIGKTTLAKLLYNRLCNHFEHCSFLTNICATSQQHKGIEDLQKQLLLNILGRDQNIANIDQGATIIEDRCCRKKVLIVLDDINHKNQLDALVGKPDWFGRGTIIIITSRRKDLLKHWEDSFTYELNGLNADQSFMLFCMHAFKRSDSIPDEYTSIAKEIVSTTGGLPLAIEVIGSLLYRKEKFYWEGNLKILKEIPHHEVQEKLKISFDALEYEEKQIFLDITCMGFYLHGVIENAFFMWDACGFYPEVRIDNLISLSLMKIGKYGDFIIHDQLRDLGREIVRKESIDDLGRRSRIWKVKDGLEVLELNKGTQEIQALNLYGDATQVRCTSKQFERMINLRYLRMFQVDLEGDFEDLFQNLKWLVWEFGRLDFMGSNFIPKRLVVLELYSVDNVEQWMDLSQMKNLRSLDLSACDGLITLSNISALKELEVLRLSCCSNLRNIHPTDFRMLSKLKKLFLSDCYKLKQLPNLPNSLTSLVFIGKSFKTLPDFSNLSNLEYVEFDHHFQRWNTTLNFRNLDRLTILRLERHSVYFYCLETESKDCHEEDPMAFENLQSEFENIDLLLELPSTLVKLILRNCYTLRTLPNFSDLKNLTTLSIENCPELMKIDGLDGAKSLTSVTISSCDKLSKLGGMAISVTDLELGDLDSLVSLPNLSTAKKLKDLHIYGCRNLVEIQGLDNAEGIESVVIDDCSSLERISDLSNLKMLKTLEVHYCEKLLEIRGLGISLMTLKLEHLDSLVSLPCLSTVKKLKSLTVCNCIDLVEIQGLDNAEGIESVVINDCSSLERISDLSNLKMLKTLEVHYCEKLLEIRGLGISLMTLKLEHLDSLVSLPCLSTVKKLKSLTVCTCRNLVEIQGLNNAEGIKSVVINGCSSLERISDLSNLKMLKTLEVHYCEKLLEIRGLGISLMTLKLEHLDSLVSLPCLSTVKKLKSLTVCTCRNLVEIQGLNNAEGIESVVINGCSSLERISDLSNLKMLKTLEVHYCEKLLEIRGLGISLMTLKLEHLDSLVSLPCLSTVKKLKSLTICTCRNLVEIQGLNNAEGIESVVINGCSSLERISDLSNLKMLKTLEVHYCEKLLEIRGLGISLKDLHIYRCRNLVEIQGVDNAWGIESVVINGCSSLERISDLSNLKMLKMLEVHYCEKLREIRGWGISLICLELEYLDSPEGLLDYTITKKLKDLQIHRCRNLVEIQELGNAEGIESVVINGCSSLERIGDLSHMNMLKTVEVCFCEKLLEIRGLGISLMTLKLEHLDSLVSLSCLSTVKKLKNLTICKCRNLVEIQGLDNAEDIDSVVINGCSSLESIGNLSNLKMLATLELCNCEKLSDIQGLGKLTSLTSLSIYRCHPQINFWDLSIRNAKSLIIKDERDKFPNHQNVRVIVEPLEEQEGGYLPNTSRFKNINHIVEECCKISSGYLEPARWVIRIVAEPLEEEGGYLPDLSRFKSLNDIVEEGCEIFLGCPAIGLLGDQENVHFVAEPLEEHGRGYLPDLSRFKNSDDIIVKGCEIFC